MLRKLTQLRIMTFEAQSGEQAGTKGQSSLLPELEFRCINNVIRTGTWHRGGASKEDCGGFSPGSLWSSPGHWIPSGLDTG